MSEFILKEKAKELIDLKIKIKNLMAIEQELKNEIKPLIKNHGAIDLDCGRIYYAESKGSESFSRKEVLQYLRDAYGDMFAEQVDIDCTKQGSPRQIVYVKLNDL